MTRNGTHYHFIGLGGIGMSGLAELLVRQGCRVSGSDLAANALTRKLEKLGVTFFPGHHSDHLQEDGVVIISSAITPDNPELTAARQKGLTVISRAQMLARLMQGHTQIAVAGAHGKTTTTTMVATVLRQAGLDPSVMVGGVVDTLGSNAILGAGKYFVAEADESDGSFLVLSPHVAVITNIDREHLDHYRDLAHIQEVFARFANQVQPRGVVVACADDANLAPVLSRVQGRLFTYGLHPGADLWAADLVIDGFTSRYRLMQRDRALGEVVLPLAGRHYASNSVAAAAVGCVLGLDFLALQGGLANLGRIQRRFEIKGEVLGVTVVDDYGHHPTEIKVTLEAMAEAFRGRRLLVAFQPHRYSRTQALLSDFFGVFGAADLVFLTEIYSAGEPVIRGISGRGLYQGVKQSGHAGVCYEEDRDRLIDRVWEALQPGDVLITMGAGDIWKVGEEVVRRLAAHPELPLSSDYVYSTQSVKA